MATGGFTGLSADAKALIVAMELLRIQVQDNALALAANTLRFTTPAGAAVGSAGAPAQAQQTAKSPEAEKAASAKPSGGGGEGLAGLVSMFGLVAAKFAAVAGPLALIATIVTSATSGFQTLTSAVKLFASTLAPILLPFVLMLATAFASFADVMMDIGLPVMETFFGFVLDTLMPALEWTVEAFEAVVKGVEEAVSSMGWFSDALKTASYNLFGRGDSKTRSRVDDSMRDVLQSFRMSVGPKAQMSGLGDVGSAVQMAALSADPLEARLMKQQLQVLEKIESAVSRRREPDRVHDPR